MKTPANPNRWRFLPARRRPTRETLTLVAAASILLVSASCDRSEPGPAARDLLLVTIDTARADRFFYVGEGGPATPNVDRLAASGVGFVNAISPVPLTLPAHASLLTGRQPPSHTVRDNGAYRLPAAETTLAEILTDAGFATGAFIGAEVLDARYGIDQGFRTYDDEIAGGGDSPFLYYPERSGDQVVDAAVRWIAEQGEGPIFAWVHLFDPHTPYRPPEPERSRYDSPYDGEIAYADRVLGRLLDAWEQRRGPGRTLVVVTSDHGEALGQNEETTHGVLVHDATLRVPLVIRAPGMRLERNVAAPVSLIDVAPTVLSLLRLPVPPEIQGRDLSPLLRGEQLAWSPVAGYAESLYAQRHHGCAPLFALREAEWKLVRGAGDELFDLATDPDESDNVAPRNPGRAETMTASLDGLMVELRGGEAERLRIDDASRRMLESLGYASFGGGGPSGETARDPREALRTLRRMAEADRRVLGGDVEGGLTAYRSVIADEPSVVDARVRLAEHLLARGDGPGAVVLLDEAVSLAPAEEALHGKLARTLETMGRFPEALAAFDAGLGWHPRARELRNGRWRCLNQLGRQDQMLAEAERAVGEDPTDGFARFARAVACCGTGSDEGYIRALERELADLPGDPFLTRALAAARGS